LPEIITLNQNAFVPGRLISDNILFTYELTYYLLNKRKGCMRHATIQLDMSKTYDRVDIMKRWVRWVLQNNEIV
jgi:hypothetical protein